MLSVIFAAFAALVQVSQVGASWLGQASFYTNPRHGGMIAAHRTLPFGSRVHVTNLGNGRSIVLVVVDRGPFIRNRIIDVSTRAADALGFRRQGIARVRVELVDANYIQK